MKVSHTAGLLNAADFSFGRLTELKRHHKLCGLYSGVGLFAIVQRVFLKVGTLNS